eukprot:TRINITY_DN4917_c0_g1_i4.p1 TRINITY_DN4917_c0_g1~~TRINITY_DN4917_c0_g1_i4.p1  ORF type:complete len:308 (+),score=78.05 TRINITY_DN4917_c0_g1_i4:337-1260(+)
MSRKKGKSDKAALFAEVEMYNQMGDRDNELLDALDMDLANQFAEQERRMRAEEPRFEIKVDMKSSAMRASEPKSRLKLDEGNVSDPESLDDPELRGSSKPQEILNPIAKITPKQAAGTARPQLTMSSKEEPRFAATMKFEVKKEVDERRNITSELKDRSKGDVKLPPLRQPVAVLPRAIPAAGKQEEAKVQVQMKARAVAPPRPQSKEQKERMMRSGSKETALLLRKEKAPATAPDDFAKEMVQMNREEQRLQNELLSLHRETYWKVKDVEARHEIKASQQRGGSSAKRAPGSKGPPMGKPSRGNQQ